ncbi:glycoside hydrolase family 15 [bacterium SCGC AG-212-C10]|nr:glycoside hydrolase family 15 [bacterium SCGC AG-212-C10]
MPRDLPVSNGSLLVNFDLDYRIRDIYFPWIGQENHTLGHAFGFGVWVDGHFSWVGSGWDKELRYRDDTLVTDVRLTNNDLGITLHCEDAVDSQLNVFIRKIVVSNQRSELRDVRLFFTHDFNLYGNQVGDTAFYDPRTQAVIHYKLARYFLANCSSESNSEPAAFSCRATGPSSSQSSWHHGETGEMDGNPVSWGLAEFTVGTRLALRPGGEAAAHYWLAAGTSYDEVAALNSLVLSHTPGTLIERTAKYWQAWIRKEAPAFADLSLAIVNIFNRSLLILRSQIDNRGAIIAATDSDIVRFGGDTYSYVWGRDGAFIASALSRAGYSELCRPFFDFCQRALTSDGYLFQHYNPDGTLASNWHAWIVDDIPVLPIQEDSTALLLWSLWIYYECSRDLEFIRPLYELFVLKAANFLLDYRDRATALPFPSYDLWEERYDVHAYTAATVIAGLRAAARFAAVFQDAAKVKSLSDAADSMTAGISQHLFDSAEGRYARSGHRTAAGYDLDPVIDVSMLCLATLNVISADDERMVQTAEAIRAQLWCHTPTGGLARYNGDEYQRDAEIAASVPGNPWFIAILWLAEYDILRSKTVDELHNVLPYLNWCTENALASGVLAEQVHPLNGAPLCVSPLTWSHSAFVWVVRAYVSKFQALRDGELTP